MLNYGSVLRLGTVAVLSAAISLLAGREAKALYDVKPDEIPGRPGSIPDLAARRRGWHNRQR